MKRKYAISFNILIVIMEIIAFIITYKQIHTVAIQYYTEDSNLLALISSLIFLIYLLFNKKIPRWLEIFKYVSTTCLMLTFLVVIFILSPMYNFNYYYMLFSGNLIFHHLLCPIFSFITLIFFDNINVYKKDYLYSVLATSIYAVVLIILNIFKVLEGPYPFLYVYKQPIYISILWFIIIFSITYVINYILMKLYLKYRGD
ncbi:MAG: hypothetical protein II119_03395 [Bacilli bacterium]|nr:hypothetical protein [Bacilli bacterium]